MSIVSYEIEVYSSISPAKMFEAYVLDGNTLFPKVAPQAIQSIQLLQGDGEVGSIKMINFSPGMGSGFKYVVQRIDGLDRENLAFHYSVIEGDALTNKFEKISNEVEFVASEDGGCICKSRSKYYMIDDVEMKEDIEAAKGKASGLFKVVEAYLLRNLNAWLAHKQ